MFDASSILDPWSAGFIEDFVREFRDDVADVLRIRSELRRDPRGYIAAVAGLPVSRAAADPRWRVDPPPSDLLDRRVEITGPAVDAKMVVTAAGSGACGYMIDGEDSLSPTWAGVLATHANTISLVRGALQAPTRTLPVLHYRPRGLHLVENNWLVDGEPVPACLFDAGMFLYHNARELLARGSGPYLYIPKLELEGEARFWHRALTWCEVMLRIPPGSIRCTVLIETLPGLVRAESILWVLRTRVTGLNVGRWDYIFSCIKSLRHVGYVLPDRQELVMTSPELAEAARWVVNVAHRRGCHAIGGMAAAVPSRRDPAAAGAALTAVARDKVREAEGGHDGTWVAHPDLVPIAAAAFGGVLRDRVEQRHVVPGAPCLDLDLAVRPLRGRVTWDGVASAARSAVVYVDAWLRGTGCVAMAGQMEDAATAEISRALLWQWVAAGAVLDDGTRVTRELVDAVVRGEAAALGGAGTEPRPEAVQLVLDSILTPDIPEFITTLGYPILLKMSSK